MRWWLLAAFIVITAVNVGSYTVLPDQVASHFGPGGVPNGWSDRGTLVLMMEGMALLIFAIFWAAPWLVMKCPSWLVNLPNKRYWLRDDMKPAARKKLESLTAEFGVAVLAFLLVVMVLTVEANLAKPPRLKESYFLPILIAFLVYTAVWCIKILYAFRRPRGAADERPEEQHRA